MQAQQIKPQARSTQSTSLYSHMLARWKAQWKKRDMTWRLRELGYQMIGYLIISIVLAGGFGVVVTILFPGMVNIAIKFYSIITMLLLMIAAVRAFDHNHEIYLLERVEVVEGMLNEIQEKDWLDNHGMYIMGRIESVERMLNEIQEKIQEKGGLE